MTGLPKHFSITEMNSFFGYSLRTLLSNSSPTYPVREKSGHCGGQAIIFKVTFFLQFFVSIMQKARSACATLSKWACGYWISKCNCITQLYLKNRTYTIDSWKKMSDKSLYLRSVPSEVGEVPATISTSLGGQIQIQNSRFPHPWLTMSSGVSLYALQM